MNIEMSTIEVACSRCSRKYTVEVPSVLKETILENPKGFACKECYPIVKAEREKERDAEERLDREANIDTLLEKAGVRPKYRLVAPPVRYVAEWIWAHRDHNILLSGETGTGKSTSCGVVVRSMPPSPSPSAPSTLPKTLFRPTPPRSLSLPSPPSPLRSSCSGSLRTSPTDAVRRSCGLSGTSTVEPSAICSVTRLPPCAESVRTS